MENISDQDSRVTSEGSLSPGAPLIFNSKSKISRTRAGCNTCKKRKIKCDEQKPSCVNCVKHGVTCEFRDASKSPLIQPLRGAHGMNLMDLELIHNFTTSTVVTLSNDTDIRNVWKIFVVRHALKCDYVMHSLLAISALHIAHHRKDQKDIYLLHALAYHQHASSVAVSLMQNIKTTDCESLWIYIVLTMYFVSGNPNRSGESLIMGESSCPHWNFILAQAPNILHSLKSSSYNGPLIPIISQGTERWLAPIKESHVENKLLDQLENRITFGVNNLSHVRTYCEAIKELRSQLPLAISICHRKSSIMDAFVWQSKMADDFIPLLKAPTQEAVVIFAHFIVIISKLQAHWWLQDWAALLMSRSWDILDAQHKLWIRWPIEEMGWVPP